MPFQFLPFFAGHSSLAGPPPASSDTILITDDYTLHSGHSLHLHGTPGLKVQVREGAEITVTLDGGVTVSNPFGRAVGLVTTATVQGAADIVVNAGFETVSAGAGNLAAAFQLDGDNDRLTINGAVSVTSLDDKAYGVMGDGAAQQYAVFGSIHVLGHVSGYGIVTAGPSTTVNHGSIEAVGENEGVGYLGAPAGGDDLTNLGDIRARAVVGPYTADHAIPMAVGVAMSGGAFANAGHVTVLAQGVAIGVRMVGMTAFSNQADGVIQARATGHHALSIGVLMGSPLGPSAALDNQGIIRGDIAITTQAPASGGAGGDIAGVDEVQNHGKIFGDIRLGQDGDRLFNDGLISGAVDLGSGDDSFDSQHGKLRGEVAGGDGADSLRGSSAGDVLHGDDPGLSGGGDDQIAGLKGADTLGGGDGDDLLNGGGGADLLSGGSGADIFAYARAGDSHLGSADLITDLDGADAVDLSRIDADTAGGGDQAFHLVSAFSNAAGELVVSYDAGLDLTSFSGDVDGDGVADLVITAAGDHHDFANFVL